MGQESIHPETLDSPVKRLYEILEQATSKADQTRALDVWAEVLGFDRDHPRSTYLALADLVRLSQDAEESVYLLDDPNRDEFLGVFLRIDSVISHPNLMQKWGSVKTPLDQSTMLLLRLASNASVKQQGQIALSAEQLSELQAEVEELINKVLSADSLSKDLRAVLMEHLESIRHAIVYYRISGSDGLRRATEGALGTLFVHRDQVKESTQNEDTKRIVLEIFNLIGNIAQILSFALQVAQLVEPAFPLLLGSS